MVHIKESIKSGPPFFKAIVLTLIGYISFYMQVGYAASSPDASTMLANFTATVPQFMQLVTATAYVMGMYFIYKGVVGLRAFGESRTQMSGQHELKGPVILMTVGTFLLYLPTSVQAGLSTFWTDSNPYGYLTETTDQWTTMYQDCFMIVQLLGTVSFIRGLVILTHLSGQGAQPGTLGRGVAHIVAGTLCINLYDFLNAINGTLGITGVIPSGPAS
jgi:intracellular multiplication protein IcmC